MTDAPATPANENEIPEALLDAAHDAFREEVNSWRIIGPLASIEGQYFRCVRDRMFAQVKPNIALIGKDGALPTSDEQIPGADFSDKGYAIDYLQYQGIKAALLKFKELSAVKQ